MGLPMALRVTPQVLSQTLDRLGSLGLLHPRHVPTARPAFFRAGHEWVALPVRWRGRLSPEKAPR